MCLVKSKSVTSIINRRVKPETLDKSTWYLVPERKVYKWGEEPKVGDRREVKTQSQE